MVGAGAAPSGEMRAENLVGRVLDYCVNRLGECAVVADRSWTHGEALVLDLVDLEGRAWIAKAIRGGTEYERELTALRDWAPALAGRAPALHSNHDPLRLLIMPRLPGHPVEGTDREHDPDVFRQAGALTRRLHESAPPVRDDSLVARLSDRLERYLATGSGLVSPDDARFARAEVARAAALPSQWTVPCHLDNHPRNWLIDTDGVIRLIDFGHARMDIWAQDLSRMRFKHWQGRPDMREAFLTGYGRQLTEPDARLLNAYDAYTAISTIVWAREHDDPEFEEHGRWMLASIRESSLER